MRTSEMKSTGPAPDALGQSQHIPNSHSHQAFQEPECRVLLLGCAKEMENSAIATTIHGHQVRVIGKSPGLLEGLDRLESEGVQLVVLGSEFSEEELALFVLDARRRGFRGTALRVLGQVSQRYRFDPVYDSQAEEKQAAADQSTITNPPSDGSPEPSRSISFTDKERAVLARVSSGWTNMQIARDLNCSEGSVKAIIQQLFGKLGVRKRAQIVRMAFESGFRSPL